MSFKASDGIPLITWADLNALNALVKPADGSKPIQELRMHHRRWMERRLMREVSSSEFMVLSAVVARTFSWSKVIEIIPLRTFTEGMWDPEDSARYDVDEDGMPYFVGTGLGTSTVQRALATLAEKRLIERFQVPGVERNLHAYMPVSALTLFFALGASTSANVTDIPDRILKLIKNPRTPLHPGPLEEEFHKRWVPVLDMAREKRNAA